MAKVCDGRKWRRHDEHVSHSLLLLKWPFLCPSKRSAGGFIHHSTICFKKEHAEDTENEKMKRGSKKYGESYNNRKAADPQRGGPWHLFVTSQKHREEEEEECRQRTKR